jgi:hypothetical protein
LVDEIGHSWDFPIKIADFPVTDGGSFLCGCLKKGVVKSPAVWKRDDELKSTNGFTGTTLFPEKNIVCM